MKGWTILAACLVLGAAGCTDESVPGSGGSGSTRVLLTDAPFPYADVARVEVHIVSIEASASEDTIPGTGGPWVTIAAPNRTFDLLQLQQGTTALAGTVDLPAGTYRAIRVTINTTLSSITMADGSLAQIQWPVHGELQLNTLVQYALEVPEAGSNIVIDFDVGRCFLLGFSGGFVFSPWLRAVNDAVTGTISGTVTDGGVPVVNASVTAYRGDASYHLGWWDVTSGRTDSQGRYVLSYLPGAEYHVFASPPMGQMGAVATSVAVTQGQNSVVNLMMVTDPWPPSDSGGYPPPPPPDTGSGTPGGPVAGVTVLPGTHNLAIGDSIGVYASLVNAQGQALYNRTVTFAISDTSVVGIQGVYGQAALLRAKKVGSVTVTATSEGRIGQAMVTVH